MPLTIQAAIDKLRSQPKDVRGAVTVQVRPEYEHTPLFHMPGDAVTPLNTNWVCIVRSCYTLMLRTISILSNDISSLRFKLLPR